MSHCRFYHKSKVEKGKFTHIGGSSVKNAGYNLVVVWECKAPGYKAVAHKQKTTIYPHAIVYDFEAYLDKTKGYRPPQTSHTKTCTCQSQFL